MNDKICDDGVFSLRSFSIADQEIYRILSNLKRYAINLSKH